MGSSGALISKQGTAYVDFGTAAQMTTDVTVFVADTTIPVGAHVWAAFQCDSTADHSADEHFMASAMVDLVCGRPVAGSGFRIHAFVRDGTMAGQFSVQYQWAMR